VLASCRDSSISLGNIALAKALKQRNGNASRRPPGCLSFNETAYLIDMKKIFD
jgi:hypothetical protein